MSKPLTPYDRWSSGTNQNSIPANDNSLRSEIFNTDGIADDVTAQPSLTSPGDNGKWYIIPAGATGTQWATFSEDSVAIFYGGTWYEFVPANGNKVSVAGVLLIFDDVDGWEPLTVPASVGGYSIVTEASAFTAEPGTHNDLTRLTLAGGDATFDDAQPYTSGMVFNIRATASIELIEDGVTLTPPAGGTLELDADMAVQVIMTGATTGIVIGQTVASP